MRLEITDYKILTKLRCKGPLDLLFRWARDVRSSRVKSQKDSTKSVSGSAQHHPPKNEGKPNLRHLLCLTECITKVNSSQWLWMALCVFSLQISLPKCLSIMGAVDNEHRWPQSPSRNSGCVLWRAVTCCDTDTTDEPTKLLRQKSTETIQSSSIYSGIEIEDLTWPFWSVWRSERHQTSRWSAARQTLVLEMIVSKAYDVAKGSLGHVESWLHACIWWFLQCQKFQRLLNVSKEFGQNWEFWWILANRAQAPWHCGSH